MESLILVIEVKRKHVLEDIKELTFPKFYQADEKARMVIQQVNNYMGANELRYGILATNDNSTPRSYKALDFKNSSITFEISTRA